jgi:hypothetical protein
MSRLNMLSAHPALGSEASPIHGMDEIAKRFRP